MQVVRYLRANIEDTQERVDWTTQGLDTLRAFCDDSSQHPYSLESYPPSGSNQKGSFLWDYVAYQQDTGILITAESEHDNHLGALARDFDKLLYANSPIKLFIFRTEEDTPAIMRIVDHLTKHMASCTEYSPAEVYVLYCRRWRNEEGIRGDLAWFLSKSTVSQPIEMFPAKASCRSPLSEPEHFHHLLRFLMIFDGIDDLPT